MHDMSIVLPASCENRRHSELSADGWMEGPDRLWRKCFPDFEWISKCEVGYVTHAVARDGSWGLIIHDLAGPKHTANGRLSRAFRTPRNVDMIVEINLAEEPGDQTLSSEEMELGLGDASCQHIT